MGVAYCHAPTARGQRSPLFGIPSIYAYIFCRRTAKFEVTPHVKRGLISESATPSPQRAGSERFPVFVQCSLLYLFVHRLSLN